MIKKALAFPLFATWDPAESETLIKPVENGSLLGPSVTQGEGGLIKGIPLKEPPSPCVTAGPKSDPFSTGFIRFLDSAGSHVANSENANAFLIILSPFHENGPERARIHQIL